MYVYKVCTCTRTWFINACMHARAYLWWDSSKAWLLSSSSCLRQGPSKRPKETHISTHLHNEHTYIHMHRNTHTHYKSHAHIHTDALFIHHMYTHTHTYTYTQTYNGRLAKDWLAASIDVLQEHFALVGIDNCGKFDRENASCYRLYCSGRREFWKVVYVSIYVSWKQYMCPVICVCI